MTDQSKYAIYVGEKVKTVSLWLRDGENEYPIYANTRGRCEWYSFDVDVYENTEATELSETFIEWLAHFYRVENGLFDGESMFLAERVDEDQPDEEPRWFETEILNALGNPGYTPEQNELMKWAYEQVDGEKA